MDVLVKRVKIGDLDFPVRISARCLLEYQEMSGEDWPSFSDVVKVMQAFYCSAKAGARFENKEFDYSYDEFFDLTEGYYLEILPQLTNALFKDQEDQESEGEDKKKRRT